VVVVLDEGGRAILPYQVSVSVPIVALHIHGNTSS
jgi:hypothetical protein